MNMIEETIELVNEEFKAGPDGWLPDGDEDKIALARVVELYFTNFNLTHGKMSGNIEDVTVGTVLGAMIDLSIRDYVLGLINDDNKDEIIAACEYLISVSPSVEYSNGPATIASTAAYEKRNMPLALEYINKSSDNYPLANLLRRVYAQGWDPSSFGAMRAELHPKVTASLFGKDK